MILQRKINQSNVARHGSTVKRQTGSRFEQNSDLMLYSITVVIKILMLCTEYAECILHQEKKENTETDENGHNIITQCSMSCVQC